MWFWVLIHNSTSASWQQIKFSCTSFGCIPAQCSMQWFDCVKVHHSDLITWIAVPTWLDATDLVSKKIRQNGVIPVALWHLLTFVCTSKRILSYNEAQILPGTYMLLATANWACAKFYRNLFFLSGGHSNYIQTFGLQLISSHLCSLAVNCSKHSVH